MASTNGLVPISRAGAFLSSYYNKYPLLPEEDIELAGVLRKSKDKFEVALELVESFQSKNSNNVFNTVMSCMPQDSRGTLVRQKRERSKTNKQAEIDADRYALLWNQQMERRRQVFQLGSATGVYKTLVKYLVGVPQVLLDFITQINGDHGQMHQISILEEAAQVYVSELERFLNFIGSLDFVWSTQILLDRNHLIKGIRAMKPSKTRKSVNIEPPQRMLDGKGRGVFSVSIGADRIVCGGEEGMVKIWDFSGALEVEKRAAVWRGLRAENRMRRQKLQKEIESSSKGGRVDQCLIAAKSQMSGERNGVWYNKRGLKVKG